MSHLTLGKCGQWLRHNIPDKHSIDNGQDAVQTAAAELAQ